MKQYFTKVSIHHMINIPDIYLLKILRWVIAVPKKKQVRKKS